MKIQGASGAYTEQTPRGVPPAQTAVSTKNTPPSAAPPPAPAAASASRRLSSLLAALKLPAGRLSATLVTAARFFSLPLNHTLLTALRRQALAAAAAVPRAAQQNPARTGPLKPSGDACALAAAAAADKDAPLSAAALAEYAAAIDPDSGSGNQSGREPDGQRRRNQREQDGDKPVPPEPLTASFLKEKLLAAAPQTGVFAALNALPGRNGQRWLVFPFSLSLNGADYRISLRILLDAQAAESRSGRLYLDLVEPASGRRRLVTADAANGKPVRARLAARPAASPRRLQEMSGALAAVLGIPPERVSAENSGASFPLTPDSGEPIPPYLDEEV